MRQLRAELGSEHGTTKRIADQLGYGVESVRSWVRQADDGAKPGVTTAEAERVKALEQEVRELRRANAILKSASAFFAAEPLGQFAAESSARRRQGELAPRRTIDRPTFTSPSTG